MRGGRQAVTALVTLVAGLAVIACGSVALAVAPHQAGVTAARSVAPTTATPVPAAPAVPLATSLPTATSAPVAAPVALTIPAIAVSTPLIRLGLTPSGSLQVPDRFDVAGWYDGSPPPGATGPAVIAGHIDSVAGPAVFYRLGLLRPGNRVYVRRADGSVAVFAVTGVGLYPKDHFPTAQVYGSVPGPQLRLITCGGTFDWARHSYLSNVVVYATAVS
ncbi:MAG TPA: class F sortase [Streptosporangiaceae bacterium]|nr:class F sortase [Streptosporangiaceae bacterium]